MNNKKNISRKLAAGQPGTKRMVEKYGDNLICVRYKYDPEKKIKYKTVELIEDSGFWDPEKKIVEVKIRFEEIEIREQVKAFGGIWDPEKKVWKLKYEDAMSLGLKNKIAR